MSLVTDNRRQWRLAATETRCCRLDARGTTSGFLRPRRQMCIAHRIFTHYFYMPSQCAAHTTCIASSIHRIVCVCVFAKNTYECRHLTSLWVCRARIYWKWNACASVGWFGGVSGMRALFFFALNLSMCEHAYTYILFCRQHAILVTRQKKMFSNIYTMYINIGVFKLFYR